MKKNCFIIKGISAVGKSSRVKVLIDFLEIFSKSELVFTIDTRNNKEKPYGILFKDFNTIFIGRKFKKGNIEKFNGYDDENKKFGSAKGFSFFLKNSDFSFVIEGSGIMRSNRFRPEFLHNYCGFNNTFIQYYMFNNIKEYENRIIKRSNTKVKDSMWGNNDSFLKEIKQTEKEIKNNNYNSFLFVDEYNCPIWDFGVKFLEFFDLPNEKFLDYCNEIKYENENLYKNW